MLTNQEGALATSPDVAPDSEDLNLPYVLGKAGWGGLVMAALEGRRMWKGVAFLALGIALILAGATTYLIVHKEVFVHVVEVAETGQIRSVSSLPTEWERITQAHIDFVIRQLWPWLRTIPDDPVVLTNNWGHARKFMTDKALRMIGTYVKEQEERFKEGKRMQIAIRAITPIGGYQRSYQIEWTETLYSSQGATESIKEWTGTIQISQLSLKDMKRVSNYDNPLGLYIEEVYWNEKLELKKDK